MKQQLINTEAKDLIKIMASLSDSSERIAEVYHKIHGENCEMEDNKDYLEAQTSINDAILKIGGILGASIAETFFCTPISKIEVNLD